MARLVVACFSKVLKWIRRLDEGEQGPVPSEGGWVRSDFYRCVRASGHEREDNLESVTCDNANVFGPLLGGDAGIIEIAQKRSSRSAFKIFFSHMRAVIDPHIVRLSSVELKEISV